MGTDKTEIAKEDDIISDLESKIIRQVEYYFGNYNLYKDRFLREQMKENDGWIPMETMIKFKRLKMLSEDYSVITSALKKSPNKLMEVSEDGTKIRRSLEKPLPDNSEDQRREVDSRSVYVKGFQPNTMLDELLEFFKHYGNPENVHMRRRPNKKFKGSVFITFSTKEEAGKFLELKDVKYKGTELLKELKPDYVKRKEEWYQEVKKEREERKRKVQEQKAKNGEKQEDLESIGMSESDIVKGCLLKLTGLSESIMWEHIKAALSPYGAIAYVDYSKGKPEAIVRFDSSVAAEVLEKASTEVDGVKTINVMDSAAASVVLEGEEEIAYWKSVAESKAKMKQKNAQRGGWQNRGGRRGSGKGRFNQRGKRKHSENDEKCAEESVKEPPPKKTLKEEGVEIPLNVKVEA